ncbi:hypothetical protein BJ165DRAFT_1532055 [Panaeolus papilionaceus]|nr:hypothetical protein BJ165DRAFT_1532055 [Panaeolus papilionaceus]
MYPIHPIPLMFHTLVGSKVAGSATRISLRRALYTGSLGPAISIARSFSTSGASVGSVTSKAKKRCGRVWSVGDVVWVRPKDCYRLKNAELKPHKPAHKVRHPMVVVNNVHPFLQLLPCSHALPKPFLRGSGIANSYANLSKGFFVDKKKRYNLIPTRISLRGNVPQLSAKVERANPPTSASYRPPTPPERRGYFQR